MRPTITCTACGTVLGLPKGGMPKDGLSCNWCGYVNVKAAEPEARPVAAAAREASPAAVAPKPKAAPHPLGDDEDDNGEPYELPPDEVKSRPCASCGKQIDLLAVVCVHCGYDAESKRTIERTFEPIDREWHSGWPLMRRLTVFAACQAANVGTVIAGEAISGSLPAAISVIIFFIALQAFLLGTFDSVRIRRNRRGQAEITITWRIAFIPMAPKKIKWREHQGIAVGLYDDGSLFDWVIFLDLLWFGIIPALLWWYYIMRADHVYAALCRDHDYPETYLYRGLNQEQAREIAQVATDATGLPLTTPL